LERKAHARGVRSLASTLGAGGVVLDPGARRSRKPNPHYNVDAMFDDMGVTSLRRG
jgi:hypothetical protein